MPITIMAQIIMTAPMAIGIGVLALMLSRANKALAEQNAKLIEAQRAAADLVSELETILENITSLLYVTNRDGRLVRVNRAFEEGLWREWRGHSLEAMRREDGTPLFFREDGTPLAKGGFPHERALAGEAVENETIVFRKEGQEIFYLVSASPIRDTGTKEITGSVTLLRDISTIKRLEQVKDEFLFTASHELRTPLAVIRAYAELGLTPGKGRRATALAQLPDLKTRQESKGKSEEESPALVLPRIMAEVDQMTGLLDQMLQIARLDAGRLPVNATEHDLYELTVAEVGLLSAAPDYARVVLDLEEATGPLFCYLDRIAYHQILVNLISNALKYSPPTSPVVVKLSTAKGRAVVSVIDYGSGIPEEELPMIFEKFYRSRKAAASGVSGLGLGLYITSRLVELLSGRIWVESKVGQGTAFHISFPLVPAAGDNNKRSGRTPSRMVQKL
ncbi:MAG: PAS domain-containing sensor histidine kinase [Bacillota bacterium]|nr:PAS domain-containing sensor histidine kinase [Bacillota bacterium]